MSQKTIALGELDCYHKEGYLILHQAFSPLRIKALKEAVDRLLDKALAGECEIRWVDQEQRLPQRTGHLLLPDKYDNAWAEWLAEDLDEHLNVLVEGSAVRHSLFGMLASGGGQPYEQAWHRDLGKAGDAGEEEFYRRHHGHSVQFNAPLLPGDHFLNIVPGSHLRASTAKEMAAASAGVKAEMPEAMVVALEPGDIVYYDANLWHRGWNPEGVDRWSMHCAFWNATRPVMAHEHGQREVFMTSGHLERMPVVARGYIERYLENYPQHPQNLKDL
jgi:ectoine hydroxylase-related dioxygenase (phytanoyl-CoA dioxygenase family)